MEFRLWGPVEVAAGGAVHVVRPPQQAAVLVALAVDAGRQVPAEALLGRVWDGEPPAQARRTVHTYLTRIRRLLERAGGAEHGVHLIHRSGGYLLDLGSATVDLQSFRRLVAEARQPGRSAERQMALLGEALAYGRGEPLAGVPGEWAAQVREGCRQQRLDVVLGWADAALRCGRAPETIGPLGDLVSEHPLAEAAVVGLMRALHAAGRGADALDRYTDARQRLADQLGIDPGPALRAAHRAVLSGAPEAAGPASAPGPVPVRSPAQLPLDVPGFVGRAAEMAELDALLGESAAQPTAVTVVALSGTAGVGKSALAVHWAHRIRDRFPAGQLFVNLHGYAPGAPVRPVEALARFLHALGLPAAEVPADAEAAADTYRSLLADRRVLVVLDNAATADQVRPLLPASAGSFVLVTSRERLGGLVAREGARRLTLGVLRPDESGTLIARTLGAARTAAEPQAAARLAKLCAHLPLALRIAAAHLVNRPGETIAGYTARLGPDNRVAALTIDDDEQAAVQIAFDLSYATLPGDARRAFRLLGLIPGADLTAEAAAALVDAPAAEAERLLDRLAAAHLIHQHVPGRYTWHDLLRLYAAGRAEAEDPGPVRRAAVVRLLHWQLATAEAAIRRLYPEMRRASPEEKPSGAPGPGFADHRSALEWLDAERANLVSSARYGAEHGPYPVTWQLADELRSYFWNCGHAVAWRAVTQAGLTAAEAAGDLVAQTTMRMNSGALSWRQDRYDQAIEQYQAALGLARRLARADLEAAALGNLGGVYRQAGRAGEAIEPLSRALLLDRRDGRPKPQNLGRLGSVYWELGRLREAAELHAQAYAIYETIGSRGGQAIALANLGETFHLLGQADQAVDQFGRALALYREVGNRDGEAEALCGLATTHAQAGRPALAVELAAEGLAVARDIGRIRAIAGALSALGAVHQYAGRPAEAARSYAEALDLAREIDHRYPEAEALAGLAAAQLHLDDAQRALALADQARAIAGRAGYRIIEGRARETLAAAYAALGRAALAATEARKARDLHGETGYRLSPNHPPAILEPR